MDQQYVWGIRFVDELICRDDSSPQRLYALQDANFNVTGITDTSGEPKERYLIDPYGIRTIMNAAWSVITASSYNWIIGPQGLMIDAESGLEYVRARYLLTALGGLMSRDSAGYMFGSNLYEYVVSNPTNELDPSGLGPAGAGRGTSIGGAKTCPPPACLGNLPQATDAAGAQCCSETMSVVTMWNYQAVGIPHTFLQTPTVTLGFYPKWRDSPYAPGAVLNDATHPRTSGHNYNVCASTLANLMASIAAHMGGWSEPYGVDNGPLSTNCTSWACGRLSDAGIISSFWKWQPGANPWTN